MRITFIGGYSDEDDKGVIEQNLGYLPYFSSDPLQKSVVNELSHLVDEKIRVYNMIFYPTTKRVFYSSASTRINDICEKINVPFLNLKLFVHFSKAFHLFFHLLKGPRTKNIVIYSSYYPFLMAVSWYKRLKPTNVVLILPDLPQFIGLNSNQSLYSKISRWTRTSLFNHYKKVADSYVFLTEQMNNLINNQKKEYCVIEGVASNDYVYHNFKNESDIKTVLYSGTLQLKYGITVLLEAIKYVKYQNVRFVFYGSGEGKNNILEAAATDQRIIYGGAMERDSLNVEQQKATILINPRQNNNEFTKYSFPSKIIEYMLSGRPVIAYKLDGTPDEYDNYLIYPENDTPLSLASLIDKLLSMDKTVLDAKGKNNREFILREKTEEMQVKKMMKLIV